MVSWLAQQPMGPQLESSDEESDDDSEPQMRLPAGYAAALGGMVRRSQTEIMAEGAARSCNAENQDEVDRLFAYAAEQLSIRQKEEDQEDHDEEDALTLPASRLNLPAELVARVLGHLQRPQDLVAARSVCRQWHELIRQTSERPPDVT